MSNGIEAPPQYRTVAFWVSVASILIAATAVVFTGLQWREAHNQLLLSIKPHVDFDTEEEPDEPPVGVAITNAGPGPAIIKSVTYYVDRKSVRDVNEAIAYGKLNSDVVTYVELEVGDALAAGSKDWMIRFKSHQRKAKPKDLDDLIDFIDQRIGIEVTFCSAGGDDCWTKCSTKDRCH